MAMTGAEARLAEEAARPVGLLFATIVREEAEILTFGLDPAARRRGVGAGAPRRSLCPGAGAGRRPLVLEVAADNAMALALYESEGFRTVGFRSGYYHRERGPAIDAWLLRRIRWA